MTRTYAAKRLLEHGPLTMREFTDITGWTVRQSSHTLKNLIKTQVAVQVCGRGQRHYLYRLVA